MELGHAIYLIFDSFVVGGFYNWCLEIVEASLDSLSSLALPKYSTLNGETTPPAARILLFPDRSSTLALSTT